MSSIFRTLYSSRKSGRSAGWNRKNRGETGTPCRHSLRGRSLRIEPLEDRHLLSVAAGPPTVTINLAQGQADVTNVDEADFTVVFSEAVTGFEAKDVNVQSTAGSVNTTVFPVGTDGTTYTVVVVGMTQTGTVTATVPAGVAQDTDGYPNRASTSTDNTVVYDVTPPTPTVDLAKDQADPTNAGTVNFAVVFSEPVDGFDDHDVTISGTAGATTTHVTGSGATYNVAVSGMTNDGTVVITVATGAADDQAGNPSLAPIYTDNIVTYDVTPPTPTVDLRRAKRIRPMPAPSISRWSLASRSPALRRMT